MHLYRMTIKILLSKLNIYKMKLNLFLSILFLLVFFLSCKNKNGHSGNQSEIILKEALTIQDEAIHIGLELDSILDTRLAQGANMWNIDSVRLLKSEVNIWRNNMVAIPGIELEHDHDSHDHDHSHDHTHAETAAHLSPEEIKNVQIEWKEAIETIRRDVK